MAAKKKNSKVEKAKREAKIYHDVHEQIVKEKPFAEVLSKYSTDQVDGFYEFLAQEKVRYMRNGATYYKDKQRAETEWVSEAMLGLKEIQQKKLFDLHCFWDAEKITLPGIETHIDFFEHENNPLGCTLIEPISQIEFDWYLEYVNSDDYQFTDEFDDSFGFYEDIRRAGKKNHPDDFIPEWFDFHNERTGNSVYFTFPMLRTEKESFYRDLAIDEREKNRKLAKEAEAVQATNTIATPTTLPKIPFRETTKFIINNLEDRETQSMYKKYNRMYQNYSDREYEYDEMMLTLAQHCEIWPIEADDDWREAFNNCYLNYRRYKIAEALPLAYEEYKMMVEMNIPFPTGDHDADLTLQLNDIVKTQILRGRELNNEPRDFNF